MPIANAASVVSSPFGGDVIVAVTFAPVLLALVWHEGLIQGPRLAAAVSAASYTVYIVHLPLLVFLRAWLVRGAPWQPDLRHAAAACAIFGLTVGYAFVVARFTEQRTGLVRQAVVRLWQRSVATSAHMIQSV